MSRSGDLATRGRLMPRRAADDRGASARRPTQSPDAALACAQMDQLAPRVLAWAAPLCFRRIETDAERDAAYRLRYEAVVERGWASAADFPDRRERDAFDLRAVLIGGFDGERLVATKRLVFPLPGLPLPIESIYGLTVHPRGQVVDWGRTVVAPGLGGASHRALAALLALAWQETRARGYHHVCGDFSPAMLRLYRRLGVRVTVLGPAAHYAGETRHPIMLHPETSIHGLNVWFARSASRDST
ncbi:MAG TPA: hypothetical protein VGB99_03660 [Acidobacteriota bacterium]